MCFPALLNLMMPIWTGKKRREGRQRNRKSKDFCYILPGQVGQSPVSKNEHYKNIKQASVKCFAQDSIASRTTIRNEGYRSYIGALKDYPHEHKTYVTNAGMLHRLHVMVSDAKAFILGTYHGLPQKYLRSYLDEFSFRFSRWTFSGQLTNRLLLAVVSSSINFQKWMRSQYLIASIFVFGAI